MLMYEDVSSAIRWLCHVFGMLESLRYIESDGRCTHAQLLIFDHEIVVGWPGVNYQSPKRHGRVCQSVLVHVDDVDAHFAHVVACGAEVISDPETHPFGERSYEVADLEGQRWHFSQHVRDVVPAEWGAAVNAGVNMTHVPPLSAE